MGVGRRFQKDQIMSAYIVTETGVVAEYPTAGLIVWKSTEDSVATLYERSDGKGGGEGFVCRVPRGCIVSFDRPGVIRQAPDAKRYSLENSLEIVAACVQSLPVTWPNKKRLQKLKATLNNFDARSGRWKTK